MNEKAIVELKRAIALVQSVEQRIELTRKAIAYDTNDGSDNYELVFKEMVSDLYSCRMKLSDIELSNS